MSPGRTRSCCRPSTRALDCRRLRRWPAGARPSCPPAHRCPRFAGTRPCIATRATSRTSQPGCSKWRQTAPRARSSARKACSAHGNSRGTSAPARRSRSSKACRSSGRLPVKILQHVKSFRTTHGGVERVVEGLVPELNRYPDLEVDVLCQGPASRDSALPGRGKVFQTRTDLAVSAAALSWRALRVWQRGASRHDIVHVHLPWRQSHLYLLLKRFRGGV